MRVLVAPPLDRLLPLALSRTPEESALELAWLSLGQSILLGPGREGPAQVSSRRGPGHGGLPGTCPLAGRGPPPYPESDPRTERLHGACQPAACPAG